MPLNSNSANALHWSDAGTDTSGPYEITGLISSQPQPDAPTYPTGLREELVLLAWLVVLLRTREDGQATYSWAYNTREKTVGDEPSCMQLSSVKVLPNLQSNVGQVAAAITHHINTVATKPSADISGPASLFVSTGPLSKAPKGANDEPVLQLEIRLDGARLDVRPHWHSEGIYAFTITQHIETLVDTIKACVSNPDVTIQDLLGPTSYDLDTIWGWNSEVPQTYDRCMHDIISERAQTCLDKVAIASWDGSLTYAQIDRYSTFLAQRLRDEYGVQLHDFLPVCFEKSRWTVVAVLAVMKSGATLVMMDPSLPLARLQNMGKQVGAKVIISSTLQQDLAKEILPEGQHMVVEANAFKAMPDSFLQAPPKLPEVPPSALMYIIFTSGSTGTPKGVQISHRTYTSSAYPRAAAVGYSENSRVLDFASYAFDVSIDSMLLTLANGGCLCIPSDEDRLNDINGVIRQMQVNYAGITPSVARILDLDVIASLAALGLGGEAASAMDVNRWGQHTRIVIGYGPCECTIGCTVNSSAATGRDYITIGPGNGAAMWLVDPNDHDTLMPVGAVGELLVEGPIVGQGYLFDPEKTAAAFVHDPKWLVHGPRDHPGRTGRLYKTGDLGRYDPFGTGEIVFVGRKDTQVKLRGQRVELGEIESQLKARLPADVNVIAEVIAPAGAAASQHTLVAFIAPQSTKRDDSKEIESTPLSAELSDILFKANAEVSEVLPRYMVPNAYIPVNFIPTLISGKTDRKRLRQFGTTVDLRSLADQAAPVSAPGASKPLTDIGLRLQRAWGQILKVDSAAIRSDDNFFALGGDSLAAMKLVTLCREQGLDLSVTSTFGHPTLSAMAEVTCNIEQSSDDTKRAPFSMIPQPSEAARDEASQICRTESAKIEDMYPCTPTQESLFTFSLKSAEAYVAQRVARIPSHIDLSEWKRAWGAVIAATPVLRARLVQLQDNPALLQVVLSESITWHHSTDLQQYLESDRSEKMNLGDPLARYAIIESASSSGGDRHMVWTLHHVVYDGWSEPLLLTQVLSALKTSDSHTSQPAHMGDFVHYVHSTPESAMQSYWRSELRGATGPQFPKVPSRDFLPRPDTLLEGYIHLPEFPSVGSSGGGNFPFTPATLIRAAWALVSSQWAGSSDIVFGETLMGRDIPLPCVESIAGPLIATVPVRIRVDRDISIAEYLSSVQLGMLERAKYQHMGMQNIRRVSRDAQYAVESPMGIVIQPEADYTVGDELGFERSDPVLEAVHFNPYSLMLACGMRKGGVRVCASFDGRLVEGGVMERIMAQMEVVCGELRGGLDRKVGEIPSLLGGEELERIWRWNATPPLVRDGKGGLLGAGGGIKPGDTYPRAVVPWVCHPQNPSWLTPVGCVGELWLEGALLSGPDIIENPAWLVAGSSAVVGRAGRVQPTGDMVKMQEDGTLVFVGRKENVAPDEGHGVNVGDLEVHFGKYLPAQAKGAAVVVSSAETVDGEVGRRLVVFVEEAEDSGITVELVPNPPVLAVRLSDEETFEATVRARVSVDLVAALKRFDKFAQNSLASHLVPSAYVVVTNLPTRAGQLDRSMLAQLASALQGDSLNQARAGLQQAWTRNLADAKMSMSDSEIVLWAAWGRILGMDAEQIDVDDNFFRLGGDSVLAMKLVSHLRTQGHLLTVADIFQKMRLGDAAKALKLNYIQAAAKADVYKPFSTLGEMHVNEFLAEVVQPKLADPSWPVQDVYPVTDSQALDVKATTQAPRTSIQYTMLYFKDHVNRDRLVAACKELVSQHDILRTVFIEHESTLLQVVLSQLEATVDLRQADGDLEAFVTDLCNTQIESDFPLGSPFFRFLFVSGPDTNQHCLVIGLSHALYDGVSLPRLLQDLEALYAGTKPADFLPFSTYISHINTPSTRAAAATYWRSLLSQSALSLLPGLSPPSICSPRTRAVFKTAPVALPPPAISMSEITTSTILTASWSLLLARRLGTTDITFAAVTSGRTLNIPIAAESIIGPTYAFTPVRITFQPTWSALDLLRHVQSQYAASSAYDYLGFEQIAESCTEWPLDSFRSASVVNHQDWDDFDTMAFAGGECKVEIANPHGDTPWPIKVVSFVRGGQTHVGVVGVEEDEVLVGELVRELKGVVEELAVLGEGRIAVETVCETAVVDEGLEDAQGAADVVDSGKVNAGGNEGKEAKVTSEPEKGPGKAVESQLDSAKEERNSCRVL
ncbi:peptide synthetase [Immersiella caudata]|uniref:Peptide synthetase n=1 Tax=Immersiella caudata TaxID=314043 RepID=A0AA39WD55_9PEZI|nr:peptide synthetase [Immersiella caudata]